MMKNILIYKDATLTYIRPNNTYFFIILVTDLTEYTNVILMCIFEIFFYQEIGGWFKFK